MFTSNDDYISHNATLHRRYRAHPGLSGSCLATRRHLCKFGRTDLFIWLKPSKCAVFQLLGNTRRFVRTKLVSSPRKRLRLGGFGPAWRAFVLLSCSLHNLRRRNRVSFFLGFVLLSRCRRDGVSVFDRNESGPSPPDPHSPQPAFLLRVSV